MFLWCQVTMPLVHPGETGNRDRSGFRSCNGSNAGAARRTTGQHIINQHHIASFQLARSGRIEADCPCQRPVPSLTPKPTQGRRAAMPNQGGNLGLPLPCPRQFMRQQRRLVEAALPKPPAMKRHRHQQRRWAPCHRFGQTRCHQPRQKPRQCDSAAMLVGKHDPARGVVVIGSSKDWRAAGFILGMRRHVEAAPAIATQALLTGNRHAARWAARRIEHIHHGYEMSGKACDRDHVVRCRTACAMLASAAGRWP